MQHAGGADGSVVVAGSVLLGAGSDVVVGGAVVGEVVAGAVVVGGVAGAVVDGSVGGVVASVDVGVVVVVVEAGVPGDVDPGGLVAGGGVVPLGDVGGLVGDVAGELLGDDGGSGGSCAAPVVVADDEPVAAPPDPTVGFVVDGTDDAGPAGPRGVVPGIVTTAAAVGAGGVVASEVTARRAGSGWDATVVPVAGGTVGLSDVVTSPTPPAGSAAVPIGGVADGAVDVLATSFSPPELVTASATNGMPSAAIAREITTPPRPNDDFELVDLMLSLLPSSESR